MSASSISVGLVPSLAACGGGSNDDGGGTFDWYGWGYALCTAQYDAGGIPSSEGAYVRARRNGAFQEQAMAAGDGCVDTLPR